MQIRLLQAGYHNRTLALYMKLGFEAREQLACVQGPAVEDLMRWCVAEGLRIMQTMTLMTISLYKEPSGSWLPSVTF